MMASMGVNRVVIGRILNHADPASRACMTVTAMTPKNVLLSTYGPSAFSKR